MAMTISQALRRIKKLKGELAVHLARAASSNTFKGNEEPAFRFGPMMELASSARSELISLETQVARTNAQTFISYPAGKVTLTEATKVLRELKSQLSWFEGLPSREHEKTTSKETEYNEDDKRVSREVVYTCDLPVAKKAAEVTRLQAQFDALNDAVETANHRTELISS